MSGRVPYQLIIEAVIESALVTWIGLLLYEISSLAPEGHYTVLHFFVLSSVPRRLKGIPDTSRHRIRSSLHPPFLLREHHFAATLVMSLVSNSRSQGISQCLITARLGFVNNEGTQNMSLTAPAFASSYIPSPGVPATPYLGLHMHPSGSSELEPEKDSTPLPAVSVV